MQYRRCGNSGLQVSAITLGLMVRDCTPGAAFESVRQTMLRAVELGVTSIDMATGYGGGSVEKAVGAILKSDLAAHRDKLVLLTKAGWADGSRRTLIAALERSLAQLGVDHVDVFYHHAADAGTPVEETAGALDLLVRQGKTRYVGISNYAPPDAIRIAMAFRDLGTPCILHQPNYNMLNRWVEDGLLQALPALGMSAAVFSAVNQGVLSDRSLPNPAPGWRAEKSLEALANAVPTGEPAYGQYPPDIAHDPAAVRRHVLHILAQLRAIASARGQTLTQLALAWVLRHAAVATALVGVSSPAQVEEAAGTFNKPALTPEEVARTLAVLPLRKGLVGAQC